MNLTSKQIIKKLSNKLLNQTIITQTLLDILIENDIISERDFQKTLQDNIGEIEDMVIENKEILNNLEDSFDEDIFDSDELKEDSVMRGIYYGPIGEA
tara:strand:- start:263 stop:556 length:294 start_codon:yes stop_codon:yes gene_type:complete